MIPIVNTTEAAAILPSPHSVLLVDLPRGHIHYVLSSDRGKRNVNWSTLALLLSKMVSPEM